MMQAVIVILVVATLVTAVVIYAVGDTAGHVDYLYPDVEPMRENEPKHNGPHHALYVFAYRRGWNRTKRAEERRHNPRPNRRKPIIPPESSPHHPRYRP